MIIEPSELESDKPLMIRSVRIGSGSIELIATVKAVSEGVALSTANFTKADLDRNLDYVLNNARRI